jgi:hypothetical protein
MERPPRKLRPAEIDEGSRQRRGARKTAHESMRSAPGSLALTPPKAPPCIRTFSPLTAQSNTRLITAIPRWRAEPLRHDAVETAVDCQICNSLGSHIRTVVCQRSYSRFEAAGADIQDAQAAVTQLATVRSTAGQTAQSDKPSLGESDQAALFLEFLRWNLGRAPP